jgi:hypothetical protein
MATNKPKTEKPALKKRGPNGGARPGAGRPAFVPTDAERKQVEAMSGYGLPIDQIAVLVRDGISADTLCAHFPTELIKGKAKANGKVGQTLFQKATGGDTTAMIWWSKTQMRWREVQQHEITGRDGAPIAVATLDVKSLSTEALAEILAAKDAAQRR